MNSDANTAVHLSIGAKR